MDYLLKRKKRLTTEELIVYHHLYAIVKRSFTTDHEFVDSLMQKKHQKQFAKTFDELMKIEKEVGSGDFAAMPETNITIRKLVRKLK